jgi:predicted MFS family arabinose efflux permease
MPEKPAAKTSRRVGQEARRQLKTLLKSRTLLTAALMVFLLEVSPGFGTPLLFYQSNVLHFSKPYVGLLASVGAGFGLLGAIGYGLVCRRFSLRGLINLSIVVHTAGTLLYLYYHSRESALIITAVNGVTVTLATLPVYDLAMRATPRGSEAVGYSVMMSVWNFTGAFSDWLGSALNTYLHVDFHRLVWLNAGTTALILFAVPLTPRLLLASRDGDSLAAETSEAVIAERS